MNENFEEKVKSLHEILVAHAEKSGYHINPDPATTMPLVEGLLKNRERYGYGLCPCRLTGGNREADLDIICPCDYRDSDLEEYDNCYCGLYVSKRVLDGDAEVSSIPERRPVEPEARGTGATEAAGGDGIRVWRCRVCGYLCAREGPPETCPVCNVSRDRFELFDLSG